MDKEVPLLLPKLDNAQRREIQGSVLLRLFKEVVFFAQTIFFKAFHYSWHPERPRQSVCPKHFDVSDGPVWAENSKIHNFSTNFSAEII